MIVSRNNLRYNRQGSKDSTSTIASSKSSNSQRGGITSNNNSIHQLYTLRNRSNNATTSNNNFNPNHNLNYLLYEIPEQYSRANSSISTNSDLISARPPNIRNNSSENKIKIVIKNSDDNPFNNNNNNNGIFKSNYQINFNSSCHNNNKNNNNNNNSNNSGNNGKRPHLFSSNGSSTSLSQKSNSSSKQSMSPNSLYSPQLNQVKTGSTSLLTDQHNLTRAITNSNNNSNNNIIMSRNNNNNNSNSNNNNNNNNKFYDEFTLKNNASFLDSISSLNENKNINENGFKSNISKQLRINQKMSHLKNNMEKKDVFANENEKYFYSDVKFINDEINQQYKNLKKQTFTTVGKESEKCFVTNKYNDIILRDEDISNNSSSNKKLDSEKSTVSENDSSMITPDLLTKLATKVWEEAEKL